jgi:hydrogenase nickel incorporation protein HypA/HybF
MHELPVTEQLLSIVLEHSRKAEAKRVTRIHLVIGELVGFVGDSIRFYFDIISKQTEAENALLSITQVEASAICQRCKKEFHPSGMQWECPACGGPIGEITRGRELYVESIDVE